MADEKYKSVSTFALPDEYQRQASEARRRRRMAEMLAQQAYQPGDIQNAPIPRAAPLVQGLQAYLTARAARKADEAEESAKTAGTKEARDFLRALTDPAKTMTIGEAAMQDIAQAGTPELVDGRLEYRKTAMPAPTPKMIPQAGPQVQLGRRPEDDQVYMPTATGRETDPQRMAAMLANTQYKAEFTPEQKRALALEGMLTSQNPMLQNVAGAIYPTLVPKTPEIKTMEFGGKLLNIIDGKATPVTMNGAAVSEPTKPKTRTSAQDFGGFIRTYYSDGSYTDEKKTPDPSSSSVANSRGGRGQQGPAFALANGKVVQSTFDPLSGQYTYQSDKGRVPVPADAKPTTASAASGLSEKQYITYRQEAFDHRKGLERLDSYFQTVGDTNVGLERYADAISAKAKNLFGKTLKPEELALQVAAGKLNGLLGLFRVDIVGPGVLTEYDAGRVIEALGGDLSALQDKERVRILLEQLYQDKKDRLEFLAEELGRSDSVRGGKPITASDLPSNLGSQNKVEVDY